MSNVSPMACGEANRNDHHLAMVERGDRVAPGSAGASRLPIEPGELFVGNAEQVIDVEVDSSSPGL
jgi:hypothetical protein